MRRQAIFLLFAVVAAALAALMVNNALKLREAEIVRARAQSVEILVAARDLTLGTRIDQSSVKFARWSLEDLPPGAIKDLQEVMSDYVRRAMVTNEPVTAEALFNGDKNAGVMPLVIPPGMRAMSVPVDEVSDIAGFVLPHARVDVLAALGGSEGGQKPVSKIVLENVEVLAVAQELEKEKDQPELVKVVTLLVKPDEAELLALASHEGVLRLAMRNYSDQGVVQTAGADLSHLLSSYSPALPPPPHKGRAPVRPAPVTVEIMRDGRAMHPAAFVNSASAEPGLSTQEAQWAEANEDKSTGPAQPAKPPAAQQNNAAGAATSAPSAKPQAFPPTTSANVQLGDAGTAPDRKTIDVDP
jgi:pilus assembly protein CpaB